MHTYIHIDTYSTGFSAIFYDILRHLWQKLVTKQPNDDPKTFGGRGVAILSKLTGVPPKNG